MSKWRCNSCGGTYSDADGYQHVCTPEIIEYAEVDAGTGKIVKPEKRTPRPNVRDERLQPGTYFVEGKATRQVPNPEERGQFLEVEGQLSIIAEGAGRTLLEP